MSYAEYRMHVVALLFSTSYTSAFLASAGLTLVNGGAPDWKMLLAAVVAVPTVILSYLSFTRLLALAAPTTPKG